MRISAAARKLIKGLTRRSRRPPSASVSKAASGPAFAAKANDLDALRAAVVDAASVSSGLWLSYLFVLLYLAIAVGSVTHRDLLFEKAVKLPFLNVELPLVAFFVIGPGLFLIVHAYVLLHFVLLAGKAGAFHAQLQSQIADAGTRWDLRRQLPSNIFVQSIAGPPEVRFGLLGAMYRSISEITLVYAPIALLMLFQFQFLAYHSETVTWWQRIVVMIDIFLLWRLWPPIARGDASRLGILSVGSKRVAASILATGLTVAMVFGVATFPNEWLDKTLPTVRFVPTHPPWQRPDEFPLPPYFLEDDLGPIKLAFLKVWEPIQKRLDLMELKSLHELLVAGDVDTVARRPVSLWSNRLVLPELDATANPGEVLSLRGRRLEGAVLTKARLRGVDFTGARMQRVSLDSADLRGAIFECGYARLTAITDYATLKDESSLLKKTSGAEDCTLLQGALLRGAKLQGAVLDRAFLHGANLSGAQMHGVSMYDTKMQGTSLSGAELHAARFAHTDLRGADLSSAELYGAIFFGAKLAGAYFENTSLLGVTFEATSLESTRIDQAFVWRSKPPILVTGAAKPWISAIRTEPAYSSHDRRPCSEQIDVGRAKYCRWTAERFESLKASLKESVTDSELRTRALERIQFLDPAGSVDDERSNEGVVSSWRELEEFNPAKPQFAIARAAELESISCGEDGSYVIHALLSWKTNDAELALLAPRLLDETKCDGARNLSKADMFRLEVLRAARQRVLLEKGAFQ